MKGMLIVAALLFGADAARAALPVRDPDWPCQQIRMGALSVGAVWTGPALDAYAATWSNDPEIADLAGRIAQRRLPIEQAEQAIRDFAQAAGGRRTPRLLALMAGLFATLDAERSQVLTGLDRFGHRQKELAADIRADMDKLHAENAVSDTQISDRLGWETRLFEQRRQAVAYACDVPNIIEQRLYALARVIQGLL